MKYGWTDGRMDGWTNERMQWLNTDYCLFNDKLETRVKHQTNVTTESLEFSNIKYSSKNLNRKLPTNYI